MASVIKSISSGAASAAARQAVQSFKPTPATTAPKFKNIMGRKFALPIPPPLAGGSVNGVHGFDPRHQPRPQRRAMSTATRGSGARGVRSWDSAAAAKLKQQLKARAAQKGTDVFPPTKWQSLVSGAEAGGADADLKIHSFIARVTAERAADTPVHKSP